MVTIKEMFDIDHTYAIHILPTSTACFPGNRKIAWFLRHNEIIDMAHFLNFGGFQSLKKGAFFSSI